MNMNLAIEGMHCGACVNRVRKALESVPVVQVKNVEIGAAEVSFDENKTSSDAVLASVKRAGYPAEERQAA